jgi:putative thioredoxin
MSAALPVSTADFPQEVLAASQDQPVLVDFWAPWCGPCRMLGPVLDRIAAEYADGLKVVKVNTDEEPELASRFQIRGIPAVKLFREGRVVDEFVGAQPLPAVRAFLAPHLQPPADSPLQAARDALGRGDYPRAVALLRPLRDRDPDDAEVALDLARALALAGHAQEVEPLLRALPPVLQTDARVLAVRALLHFAAIASCPDETDAIQSARVRAAQALLRADVGGGIEELLGAMQRNRRFATGQGKADLVHAFTLGSPDDPGIAQARRRLATLIH